MFWKKKNKKETRIENTPLGSCAPSSCGGCAESGCGSSSVKPNSNPNAINDQKASVNVIQNLIAIGSGKGGVGKSTVTMNLAHALKLQGFSVGVLDADIYGPSQAAMLGAQKEKPMAFNGMIKPLDADGIKFISMANLTGSNGPTIWRAPIAVQAIQQFLHGVHWGKLDFLLIDLPPGTGDIQITLSQEAQLNGAIIVSTPQKVAADVSKMGLEMFKQVNVPILGIVENMASFACSHCDTESKLFKSDALKKMAKATDTKIIGSIPLDGELMESCDAGKSIFETDNDSASAKAFTGLAINLLDIIKVPKKTNKLDVDGFKVDANGALDLVWSDGHHSSHQAVNLRSSCQCAKCVDEMTGKPILDPGLIASDIKVDSAQPVGLYGLAIQFSDGHNSGIYKLDELR